MPASFSDLKNAWAFDSSFGSNTFAATAGTPLGGKAVDMSDGHDLTNAIIMLGQVNGTDSPVFGLQESASSVGTFTPITDANASITLGGTTTIGVITGQRKLQYCRVAMNVSASDTVAVTALILDFRAQMPLGASGSSRSPAGPSTVS